jgi:nucleoside-diphosphate-sugar epimerase
MQAGDVQVTYANINKAKELLGYDPKTSVVEGIHNFVEWYKAFYMKEGNS